VVDFRIYRAAFAPAMAVVIVLLFSLEGTPPALSPSGTPIAFDQRAAAQNVRQLLREAPERTPGSAGDEAAANLVAKRFRAIRAGEISEQQYDSDFEGDDVTLRNVLLTLPGETERTIAIVAARDSARGQGAVSSAAATAALLELAQELGATTHAKTLLFASTDGGSDGATGARRLTELPEAGLIEAFVVISQPGTGAAPAVIATAADDRSASIQLVRTAEHALSEQAQARSPEQSAFDELAGLAFPSGLGEQAALIAEGARAVAVSGSGERLVAPDNDQPDDLDADALGANGRTALATVLALDTALAPPEQGPNAYLSVGGSLVPGWILAVLALALLLPAALAAADGVAHSARAGGRPGRAAVWVASLSLGLLAALATLYVLALIGVVDRPRFPFDPGRFEIGITETLTLILLAAVALRVWYERRAWRIPTGVERNAAVPAAGCIAVLAVLVVWLANPYLALLLVPLAHVWLVGVRRPGRVTVSVAATALALAAVPAVAALLNVAGRLDLGLGAPWQFVLMLGDRQVPAVAALGLCLLGGYGIAVLLTAGAGPSTSRPKPVDASPIAPRLQKDDKPGGV
jgi:peptidase M28-like protein